VRRACIDIGSNTTRLLVADCAGEGLAEVHQERAFTRIGRVVVTEGEISAAKISEVIEVVCDQLERARELGAGQIHGVATAAIRHAPNGQALVEAIHDACGLQIQVLSGEEEARLAFLGALRTLGHVPSGSLAVVDVGGGSSELVVGTAPDEIAWSTSFAVGSGELSDRCLRSDPPSEQELDDARASLARALEGIEPPRPAEAVAVGGSATSLRAVAGSRLDGDAFRRALALLTSDRAAELARRFGLDAERVRLLPAGLLILEAASEMLRLPLQIGRGGVREGVLLEAGS
jgi:exopolyphosphatase / guanosine-5'-triphosphate,3'-diphosphate pyrophosphatase